ncbi:MAG: hypothetical protein AABY32_01905 [Nanoarchaeota archaeon]
MFKFTIYKDPSQPDDCLIYTCGGRECISLAGLLKLAKETCYFTINDPTGAFNPFDTDGYWNMNKYETGIYLIKGRQVTENIFHDSIR